MALACAPLLVRAAAPGRKRLAILSPADATHVKELFAEMLQSLANRGFVQGARLEVFVKTGPDERPLSELAKEVVAWRPDVIVADGSFATNAARLATRSIPIVTSVADPVASGFAQSLARPGGNVTGLSQGFAEVALKLMELLRLLSPKVARVTILHWEVPSIQATMRSIAGHFELAARQMGIDARRVGVREWKEVLAAIRGLRPRGVDAAVLIGPDPEDSRLAGAEAIAAGVPLVSTEEKATEAGMLASFSSEHEGFGRRLAAIVEQIFAGADPARLPFQSPERFRLVLNRRTAAALGIAMTPELLVRADRIID